MTEALIALTALTAMEIVLGIDNIVFIAVLTSRLPEEQRLKATRWGLSLALLSRIALLLSLTWILQLKEPLFQLSDIGLGFLVNATPEMDPHELKHLAEVDGVSVRDLILLVGGLFLIRKSVKEIHEKINEHEDGHPKSRFSSFSAVLMQIAVLDIIFSLDSVITAVGMAKDIRVMVAAIVLSVIVMLVFASRVTRFVNDNPTLKILALSFLILVGVVLVSEGVGAEINKGYIYFAMMFSLIVELVNLRVRKVQPAA